MDTTPRRRRRFLQFLNRKGNGTAASIGDDNNSHFSQTSSAGSKNHNHSNNNHTTSIVNMDAIVDNNNDFDNGDNRHLFRQSGNSLSSGKSGRLRNSRAVQSVRNATHAAMMKSRRAVSGVVAAAGDATAAPPMHPKQTYNAQNEFFSAVQQGRLDIVKRLMAPVLMRQLQKSAQIDPQLEININAFDNKGMSALHYASGKGHLDIIKYLYQETLLDLNARVPQHFLTALHFAAFFNQYDVVDYILKIAPETDDDDDDSSNVVPHYSTITNLHASVSSHAGFLSGINIKAIPVEVNAKARRDGWTPLLAAADQGHDKVVQRLLQDPRVNVNVKTKQKGDTALHLAARGGYSNVCRLLISRIELDLTNFKGQQAWEVAGTKQVADFLKRMALKKSSASQTPNSSKVLSYATSLRELQMEFQHEFESVEMVEEGEEGEESSSYSSNGCENECDEREPEGSQEVEDAEQAENSSPPDYFDEDRTEEENKSENVTRVENHSNEEMVEQPHEIDDDNRAENDTGVLLEELPQPPDLRDSVHSSCSKFSHDTPHQLSRKDIQSSVENINTMVLRPPLDKCLSNLSLDDWVDNEGGQLDMSDGLQQDRKEVEDDLLILEDKHGEGPPEEVEGSSILLSAVEVQFTQDGEKDVELQQKDEPVQEFGEDTALLPN